MRYFVYIAYKGTNYHGWQAQPNANTVQAEINKALQTLYRQPIATVGSGRTDTGVHAKEQVCHCDLPDTYPPANLGHKLNSILPPDIVINKIVPVIAEAHARYSALSRSYEYHIRFTRTPFNMHEYYYLPKIPDFALMNAAAATVIGSHDFTSFSRVKTDVNNFICEITDSNWHFTKESAVFTITANRFLRGMVRALVGTLLNVGFGRLSLSEFTDVVKARDRKLAGQSVPPQGLYLCAVRYPEDIFIK